MATKRMLINATHPDELRVAITSDSTLIDLVIEHPGQEQKKSNIYKGRITSIEPSLGAVFVNFGSERHGFLPLKEISPEYFLSQPTTETLTDIDIKKILKEGQEIVIQVDKEERGTKGAALTTFITLAGCYLVLMPNNPDSGGISRRIEGEDRDQLRQIIDQLPVPEGMGIIIRTAGVSRSKEELEWDLKVLLRYWEAIKQAAVAKPGPYLIHQESDVIIRAVRDHLRQDISEVIIDNPEAYQRAKEYIRQVRPDFIDHIKLYSDAMPLFSRFQIERQIEAAYQREVRLPSGGSIVIDHTEALVAIDINSSRATKGGNIEETALQTNLEAADEIAKQLRIRDIGGLVVIDFIDMTPSRNQREVENRLRNALEMDRARIQIGRISRFGLLEMSRQRLRAALSVSTETPCPRCEGHGSVRSIESLAISIIHLIQENTSRNPKADIQVQLPIDVATYLMNEQREMINDIQKQSGTNITLIPNSHLQSPQYAIKNTRDESLKTTPSYKLVKAPKPDVTPFKPNTPSHVSEPAISQYLSDTVIEPPLPKKSQGDGLIKRLWDTMFGSEPEIKKPTPQERKQPQRRPQRTERGGERPQRQSDEGGQHRNKHKKQRDDQPGRRENRDNREGRENTRDNRENREGRENRDNREGRDNRDKNRNRNRDQQNQRHEKPAQKPAEAPATVEAPKPVIAAESVIENKVTAVETTTFIEKQVEQPVAATTPQPPVEKPIEKVNEPASIPAAPEAPVFVPPPVPATPSNYKGLSSEKPLQQVTTKK